MDQQGLFSDTSRKASEEIKPKKDKLQKQVLRSIHQV